MVVPVFFTSIMYVVGSDDLDIQLFRPLHILEIDISLLLDIKRLNFKIEVISEDFFHIFDIFQGFFWMMLLDAASRKRTDAGCRADDSFMVLAEEIHIA